VTERARTPAAVAGLLAFVVVILLVVAGLVRIPVRTFALRVQDSTSIGGISGGRVACEGPIRSPTAARGVGIFGAPNTSRPTTLSATVRTDGDRILATGHSTASSNDTQQQIPLDRQLPANRPVRICIRATPGSFSLLGGAAQAPGVSASGVAAATQFSLVLTRPATFFDGLQTAFSRAAIFRPDWIGAWTFWLLLAVLACALAVAAIAVIAATREDDPEPDSSRARTQSS
jgi:hypothetical protein